VQLILSCAGLGTWRQFVACYRFNADVVEASLFIGNADQKAAFPRIGAVLTESPKEAQATVRPVHWGNPFQHSKDGTVFGNRERILPVHPQAFL
jgi:guanyl-specific ribonuclease Sa